MPLSHEPASNDPSAPASSECDVCSVIRSGDRVQVHFGARQPSPTDMRITQAVPRHRVGLDEATAGRLHDLLSELLATQLQASVQ